MSNVQYDIQLEINKQTIAGQLGAVENQIDNRFRSAGNKAGSSFGNSFLSIAGPLVTSIVGALSFNKILSGVTGAVGAFNNLSKASSALNTVITGINNQTTKNNAILADSKSTIDQRALALGIDTKNIYENVSASRAAKDTTGGLERQIRDAQRAFDDQSRAIEKNIKSLQDKVNKDKEAIRNAKGYSQLTDQQTKLEDDLLDLQIQQDQAIRNNDAAEYFNLSQLIKTKQFEISENEKKIKQIDRQTDKIENLADVQIKQLRAELDISRNKFELNTEDAKRKLEDLRDQIASVGGGGELKQLKKEYEFLNNPIVDGLATVDKNQVNQAVERLFSGFGGALARSDIQRGFQNLIAGGVRDIPKAEQLLKSYADTASSNRSPFLQLGEAFVNLSQAFKTGESELGDAAGLTDNFDKIDISGLQKLQAQGKLTGKTLESLTEQERALVRLEGSLGATKKFEGGFDEELKSGRLELAKFNATMLDLQENAGKALAPVFNKIVETITPFVKGIAQFIKDNPGFVLAITGIAGGLSILATVFGLIIGAVTLVGGIISTVGAPVLAIVAGITIAIGALVAGFVAGIVGLVTAYNNNFGGFKDKIDGLVKYFQETIVPKIQPLFDEFSKFFKNIKPYIDDAVPVIEKVFSYLGDGAVINIKGVIKVLGWMLDGLKSFVHFINEKIEDKTFEKIATAFKVAFIDPIIAAKNAMEAFVKFMNTSINTIIRTFNSLRNGLPDVELPGVGNLKQMLPEISLIPGFANGGSFIVPPGFPNDSFLMGVESGERVDVTPANQITDSYNNTSNYYNYGNQSGPEFFPSTLIFN